MFQATNDIVAKNVWEEYLMETNLNVVNSGELSVQEKDAINQQIDQMIARHKSNRYEINRLVFESVTALTESENYSEELASRGIMKRAWGSITGKNKKLQNSIDNSLAKAQYTSQQTLQKLAEQNLMSFELITAVNNKLNASLIEMDAEINNIYKTLVNFFKQTQSNIVQLENRVEKLERNVNLLNWQNSIEYQMWDGVEYSELRDVEKIVRLTRDFYDITKGNWTTSDLLLLKTAMSSIGLMPKELVSYKAFIQNICTEEKLFSTLFEGLTLEGVGDYASYMALSAGIHKVKRLESDEAYIIDNIQKVLERHGCPIQVDEIKYNLLKEYGSAIAGINVDANVVLYDFMLELLYNIAQVKELQYVRLLPDKMKEAEQLFAMYDIEKVFPILEQLADYGYIRAKYLMALVYETGYTGIPANINKFQSLLDECIEAGDVVAQMRRMFPMDEESWEESIIENFAEVAEEFGDKLAVCSKNGDVYAELELARLGVFLSDYEEEAHASEFISFENVPAPFAYYHKADLYDIDEKEQFELYEKSAQYGYAPAEYELASCYAKGIGCEKNEKKAFELFVRAEKHGYLDAINRVGNCYSNGNGVEQDDKMAFEYFWKGANLGLVYPISNVGWAYRYGRGVAQDYKEAAKYYKMGIETGKDNGYCHYNLGMLYLNGQGVQENRSEAKKLLEIGAKLGNNSAKEALKENF